MCACPFVFTHACPTDIAKVTVWNSLVRRYFRRVRVGDVIAIRGARRKYNADSHFAYSSSSSSSAGDADSAATMSTSVSFSLNARNPTGSIFFLAAHEIPRADEVLGGIVAEAAAAATNDQDSAATPPACVSRYAVALTDLLSCWHVPDGQSIDVAGLVVYAGACGRACVCMRVQACACVCNCACVRACGFVGDAVCTHGVACTRWGSLLCFVCRE